MRLAVSGIFSAFATMGPFMRLLLLSIVLTLPLGQAGEYPIHSKRIAITFDDAPRSDGPLLSGAERAERLIAALDDANVEGAMFFVTTGHLAGSGEEGVQRLNRYAASGQKLANHSHRHLWLHRTSADDYLADIDEASRQLSVFDDVEPYFRFPFLDEGRDVAKRDTVREGLEARGLRNGYVTVDNYDWYMANLFAEALKDNPEPDLAAWQRAYVEILVDAVEFYDRMAIDALGRSPAHVLLLHENDLAALFVDDLVAALRQRGWETISAIEAYQDPIADIEPDTLFLGQGRVAALARVAGRSPRDLVHLSEDEQQLRREFERRGLIDKRVRRADPARPDQRRLSSSDGS